MSRDWRCAVWLNLLPFLPLVSYLRGLKFLPENAIVGTDMEKGECKGDHQGHLCVLASNDRIDSIKELTRNPEYICFNCGRVADCDDNLCNPMSLKD